MICRSSRDRLALALRRYVSGHATNDDLYGVEVDWRDRGAIAVWDMAWLLYDDLCEHRATGRHALGPEQRREIAKWIVFLQSDSEYVWPEYSFIQTNISWLGNVLTLGLIKKWREQRWCEFQAAGDFTAWPFVSSVDLRFAVTKPRFLSGENRA